MADTTLRHASVANLTYITATFASKHATTVVVIGKNYTNDKAAPAHTHVVEKIKVY